MPKPPKAAGQAPVATHEGIEIFLDAEGVFYCQLETGGRVTTSGTLKALKARIDDHRRNQARLTAAATPCVVLGRPYYSDEDEPIIELEGVFLGLNAHTGAFKLRLTKAPSSRRMSGKTGEIVTLDDGRWHFYRPEDRAAIDEMKRLTREVIDADKALRVARDRRDAHEAKASRSLAIGYSRGSKAEAAAQTETALIEFLTAPKTGG